MHADIDFAISQGINFIDMYSSNPDLRSNIGMIHYVDSEEDFRQVFDGPILQLALRLKSEGRIRHIGLSTHNPTVARLAVESSLIEKKRIMLL